MTAGNSNFETSQEDELIAHLGESIEDILNFDSWSRGDDLEPVYTRLEQEIQETLKQQARVAEEIRRRVLPLIRTRKAAPPGAGLYSASLDQLKWMQSNLLFNGATLAADGTVVTHDTLLLTAVQLGICTVSYLGKSSEIRKQLFYRDVRLHQSDPIEEMIELLEQRQGRPALGYEDARDELNYLMRRSLMAYAERGLLLRDGKGSWLMGHGHPVPREILSGGLQALVSSSLDRLSDLVLEHKKFVFVPSATSELLITTLGDCLLPLQFLIVDDLSDLLQRWINRGRYNPLLARRVQNFVKEVGPKLVRGVYRASMHAPAQVFYAHVEHAQEAALIVLADSVLQEHRGFPLLLDMADSLCRVSFEPQSFRNIVQQGYASAGQPYRYLTERETRR